MTVLIDPPAWPAHGRRWSHLVSDVSFAELHDFARRTGVPERGFEGDHYDVPEERYAALVAAGAVPVSSRELLRRLQTSGLRRPKRRGERVLASVLRHDGADAGRRVDAVLSPKPPPWPIRGVVLAVVAPARDGALVLVEPDGAGWRLPHRAVSGSAPAAAAPQGPVHEADVLGHGLLGTGWHEDGGAGVAQVGYLRIAAPPGSRPPAGRARRTSSGQLPAPSSEADLVLRRTLRRSPRPAAASAQWARFREAVGVLPPEVAPLLRWSLQASPAGAAAP